MSGARASGKAGWRTGSATAGKRDLPVDFQTWLVLPFFLGKPAENASGTGAPIDSIEICRLYLRHGRVLWVERFSRKSGREEHVDVEPPQLDEKNWYLTSEETLGFLSLDGGATWDRISVDVGFEGISWAISRLAQGVPRLWEFYIYTYH